VFTWRKKIHCLFDVILHCSGARSSWLIGSEFVFRDQSFNIGKQDTWCWCFKSVFISRFLENERLTGHCFFIYGNRTEILSNSQTRC
jgi:hypothetical protein